MANPNELFRPSTPARVKSRNSLSTFRRSNSNVGNAAQTGGRSTPIGDLDDAGKHRISSGGTGRVHVAVRIRPPFQSEVQSDTYTSVVKRAKAADSEDECVSLLDSELNQWRRFSFDRAFGPKTGQQLVYNRFAKPIVDKVCQGINGTIMAYGQTGTGKTFTMGILGRVSGEALSSRQHTEQEGIVSRALADIWQQIGKSAEGSGSPAKDRASWNVTLSFVQIYTELVQDLLEPENDNLPLRESPDSGFYVEGVREERAKTLQDAIDIINLGLENRMMAPTLMNATSSRSHTVLTIRVMRDGVSHYQSGSPKGKSSTIVVRQKMRSKLTLVDLAGSERVSKTQSDGMRLEEAKAINQSLSTLGNVIAALSGRSTSQKHVPFRDSKLTKLLQDALGGNSVTGLIATVGPSQSSHQETLSTLLFAQRCRDVRTYAVVNAELDYKDLCSKLEKQLEDLEVSSQQREDQLNQHYQAELKSHGVTSYAPPPDAPSGAAAAPRASRNQSSAAASVPPEDIQRMVTTLMDAMKRLDEISVKPLMEYDRRQRDDVQYWKTCLESENADVHSRRSEVVKMNQDDPRPSSQQHRMKRLADLLNINHSVTAALQDFEKRFPEAMLKQNAAMMAPIVTPGIDPKDATTLQRVVSALVARVRTLTELLDFSNKSFRSLKRQHILDVCERETRKLEFANWSKILKHLLNTNLRLRNQLAGRYVPLPEESRTDVDIPVPPAGAGQLPFGSDATTPADSLIRVVRAVTTIQRRWRQYQHEKALMMRASSSGQNSPSRQQHQRPARRRAASIAAAAASQVVGSMLSSLQIPVPVKMLDTITSLAGGHRGPEDTGGTHFDTDAYETTGPVLSLRRKAPGEGATGDGDEDEMAQYYRQQSQLSVAALAKSPEQIVQNPLFGKQYSPPRHSVPTSSSPPSLPSSQGPSPRSRRHKNSYRARMQNVLAAAPATTRSRTPSPEKKAIQRQQQRRSGESDAGGHIRRHSRSGSGSGVFNGGERSPATHVAQAHVAAAVPSASASSSAGASLNVGHRHRMPAAGEAMRYEDVPLPSPIPSEHSIPAYIQPASQPQQQPQSQPQSHSHSQSLPPQGFAGPTNAHPKRTETSGTAPTVPEQPQERPVQHSSSSTGNRNSHLAPHGNTAVDERQQTRAEKDEDDSDDYDDTSAPVIADADRVRAASSAPRSPHIAPSSKRMERKVATAFGATAPQPQTRSGSMNSAMGSAVAARRRNSVENVAGKTQARKPSRRSIAKPTPLNPQLIRGVEGDEEREREREREREDRQPKSVQREKKAKRAQKPPAGPNIVSRKPVSKSRKQNVPPLPAGTLPHSHSHSHSQPPTLPQHREPYEAERERESLRDPYSGEMARRAPSMDSGSATGVLADPPSEFETAEEESEVEAIPTVADDVPLGAAGDLDVSPITQAATSAPNAALSYSLVADELQHILRDRKARLRSSEQFDGGDVADIAGETVGLVVTEPSEPTLPAAATLPETPRSVAPAGSTSNGVVDTPFSTLAGEHDHWAHELEAELRMLSSMRQDSTTVAPSEQTHPPTSRAKSPDLQRVQYMTTSHVSVSSDEYDDEDGEERHWSQLDNWGN